MNDRPEFLVSAGLIRMVISILVRNRFDANEAFAQIAKLFAKNNVPSAVSSETYRQWSENAEHIECSSTNNPHTITTKWEFGK